MGVAVRYLVLDLETISIPNASDFIVTDDIEAPENYKKPEAIAGYIEREKTRRLERSALDMDLARICAIGCAMSPDNVVVSILKDEPDEACELLKLAPELDPYHRDFVTLITFNGRSFDIPLLMRRARYLGVNFPRINLDRYKSPHIDLYEELTMRGTIKAHGLRWYFKRHGWTDLIDADPLANGGADVARAWAEGHYEDVGAHVRCDVAGTIRLAQWMGVIPKAPAVL